MVESASASANPTWIPLLLALVIGLLFAGLIAAVWLVGEGTTKRKVLRTISIALWACVFCGLEASLARFANGEATTGAPIPSATGNRSIAGKAPETIGANDFEIAGEDGAADEEASMSARAYQDAVMLNVMRWLAYLNYASLI